MIPQSPRGSRLPVAINNQWVVHLVSANQYESGSPYYGGRPGLVGDNAEIFEALCRQIVLGALVLSFRNQFQRAGPLLVAEPIDQINFGDLRSLCGFIFPQNELKDAGAFEVSMFYGSGSRLRKMAFATVSEPRNTVEYYLRKRKVHVSGTVLPLLTSESTFTRIGVLVDNDEQAEIVRSILTWEYLGSRLDFSDDLRTCRRLLQSFILCPGEGKECLNAPPNVEGLAIFVSRRAVAPTIKQLELKNRVKKAVSAALHLIESCACLPNSLQSENRLFIGFTPRNDDVSEFLIQSGWASFAERGPSPGDWKVDFDFESYFCKIPNLESLKIAADSMKASLGLDFYVGADVDYQS